MKAAIYTQYGPPEVVSVKDVPAPTPKKNELLVRVVSSVVTAADGRIRAARFPKGFGVVAKLAFGAFAPRNHILGSCFSGVVEAIGEGVTDFSIGDEVAGMTGVGMKAHAEYLVISAQKSVVKKPTAVSHDDAAGVLFGGTAALFFIRDVGHVKEGQSVLVNGASGAVGTNAVQLAAYYGATVTAVTSGDNDELVRSIGASKVVDYETQPLSQCLETFDRALDAVGNVTIKEGLRLLKPNGQLLLMVPSLGQMFTFNKRVKTGTATEKAKDIAFILDLVAEKKLTVLIDSTFTLDQIQDAYRRLDSGKKRGNIILRIGDKKTTGQAGS